METSVIIILVIIILILLGIYLLIRAGRRLRRAGHQLDKDWSDIEVFIKQRNDELPRLIQTCRSYMPQDQASLRLLTEARSAQRKASSMQEKTAATVKTTQAVQALFSDARRFDGLKNNSTYIQLQNSLAEIEERIVERRDTFNEDVTRFNARLTRFPGSLFAGKRKLRPRTPWPDSL